MQNKDEKLSWWVIPALLCLLLAHGWFLSSEPEAVQAREAQQVHK